MAASLGEVDARTLEGLFDLFELKTGIDDLITLAATDSIYGCISRRGGRTNSEGSV